jgi:hypothetical protein
MVFRFWFLDSGWCNIGKILSCSLDSTEQITNPGLSHFFDQLEQVLQVLFVYMLLSIFFSNKLISKWIFENLVSSVSELVVGSGE